MTLDELFLGGSMSQSDVQAALTAQGFTTARAANLDLLTDSSCGLSALKAAIGTPQQAGTAYSVLLDAAHVTGNLPAVLANTAHGGGSATITANLVGNLTGNVTGNLSGSVASVTGSVGSVTGSVSGSVASVVGSVGSVVGNVGGNVAGSVASVASPVTVGTNNDKTGYVLTSAYNAAKTAAQAGDRMDLVDAPSAAAVAAFQNGLATPQTVWSYNTRTLTTS